jgi:hypothetical protein
MMYMHLAPEIEKQESEVVKPFLAGGDEQTTPTIFQTIEKTTRKKRWHNGIDVEYDPVNDIFVDANTKQPIHALLDGMGDEEFFDEEVEVDPQSFKSDNSEWIKRGGASALDLRKALGLDLQDEPTIMEKTKARLAEKIAERKISLAAPPHLYNS